MANFSALKTAIQNAIKQNGNEEITGDVLQQILLSIVSTMGDGAINTIEQNLSNEATTRQGADTQLQNAINAIKANIDNGYVYAGIATPSSTPVSGKVFYIATAAGTYTNFGGQVLTQGINILRYNGSAWRNQQLIGIDNVPTAASNSLVKSGGVQNELALGAVYDVSAKNPTAGPNNDGKWESLAALLSDANLNTLIPTAYRKGGMSIKFVHTNDNKYVQYRYMGTTTTGNPNPFIDTANWQGVDDVPTAGSDDMPTSNGMMASGGSVFSINGNGTTVVTDYKSLKKLTTGKTYILYAEQWSVSQIDANSNVIQLVYWDGVNTTVVKQVKKKDLHDILFIEFTAAQPNYYINLRADSGTSATFKIREKDSLLDNGCQLVGKATLSTQPTWGNVYYLATAVGEYTHFGITLSTPGIYIFKNDGTTWTAEAIMYIDTEINGLSANPVSNSAVYQACKNATIKNAEELSATGNGNTVVTLTNLGRLTVGKKYVLSAEKWDIDQVTANSTVLQLYYSDGQENHVVLTYKKETLPDNIRFEFVAEATWYSINLRGNSDAPINLHWREFNDSDVEIDKLNTFVNNIDNYLSVRSATVSGKGDTVVTKRVASDLVVGNLYKIVSSKKSWNYSGTQKTVLQAYSDYSGGTRTFLRGIKGQSLYDGYFVAIDSNLNIQFRADVGESVTFSVVGVYGSNNLDETIKDIQSAKTPTDNICVNSIIREIYCPDYAGNNNLRIYSAFASDGKLQLFIQDVDTSVNLFQYTFSESALDGIYKYGNCYVYFQKKFYLNEYFSFTVDVTDSKNSPSIAGYLSKLTNTNNWDGKSMVWFGTSIPTCGYPQKVAEALGATMNNFAIGASACVGGNYYLAYQVNLGHTISEKVAAVKDMWTIDDANQTFTDGPRTMGITGIPSLTTYAEVAAARLEIITSSYECLILARTLLSDQTEHDNFLQTALGDLYTYMMANYADRFAYRNIDLWVFDHGHNDDCSTDPLQLDMSQVNLTSFVGAMNTYIGLILQYKPHARICVVSDYDNFNNLGKKYTIETQKAIAERWHIPFIPVHKYLPFNINTKVRTRGYWDASAVWHDTGFEWGALDSANGMIGNGHFPPYIMTHFYDPGRPARTIQELEELLNPSQDAAGNWWYDLEPRYIWMFDGLHPHSVPYNNVTRMYAQCLAEMFKEFGTNGYL